MALVTLYGTMFLQGILSDRYQLRASASLSTTAASQLFTPLPIPAGRLGDAYIFVGRIPKLLKESKTSSTL
jgi:hypothetical protein